MWGHAGSRAKIFPRVSPSRISLQRPDEVLAQNVLRRPAELAVGGLVDDDPEESDPNPIPPTLDEQSKVDTFEGESELAENIERMEDTWVTMGGPY